MVGVNTRSLYIEPDEVPRSQSHCEVLAVSPLLRHLLIESIRHRRCTTSAVDGVLMSLLLLEVGRAEALRSPLRLCRGMNDWRLYALLSFTNPMCACRRWPGTARRVNAPSASLALARKPDYRFQELEKPGVSSFCDVQTGDKVDSVTTVALQLGYDSPGAFSTMFRKEARGKPSNFMAAER